MIKFFGNYIRNVYSSSPFYAQHFDRYTIAALIYHFTISEIIELVRTRNNMEDLTEGLFLALTYMTLCLKYLNFLMRECELRTLLDCFRAKLCQPRDSAEVSILKQYDWKGIFINSGILNWWYTYIRKSPKFYLGRKVLLI